MSEINCEWVRDRLPDRVADRLETGERERLDGHVADCDACRAELELVRALWASRPRPAPELAARIRSGLREGANRGSGATRSWWMAVAATLVLALGTGIVWERMNLGANGAEAVVLAEDLEADPWPGGEALVAGGLVWDDLSDEELQALLEDFER